MDELLLAYLQSHYTDETRDSLNEALTLLIEYDYPDFQVSCLDSILKEQDEQKEQIEDDVYQDIYNKIKDTVKQQGIYLNPDAPLEVYLEVTKALKLIQSLDDYTNLDICLSSISFDEEKIIYILTEYSLLTDIQIRDNYLECDPRFLPILKELVNNKMGYVVEEPNPLQKECINNAKLYAKLYPNALGVQLIRDGVLPAQNIELYMSYLKEHLDTLSDKDLALHLYSVILVSSSCQENPTEVYRNVFTENIDDQKRQFLIERHLTHEVSKYSEIVKENHEKNRLS